MGPLTCGPIPVAPKETCVPGENLTRDEARERARTVSVTSYEVALDLTTGDETFVSDTTIKFSAEAGADTFIDLIAPRVRSIMLNGNEVDAAAFRDSRVLLSGLSSDNVLRIVADCAYMRTGEGLHQVRRPGRQGGVPVHPVRSDRRSPDVCLLRPARSEGNLRVHGYWPR